MTYYQILGLQLDATPDQIKKAYRKLVKQYHPDKNQSANAKELIFQINEAYEVLSDPVKKSRYDQKNITESHYETEYDQREAYRMEYIRKKNLEAREAKEKREQIKKFFFTILKAVHVCLCIWAVILVTDYILPNKQYDEYAIQGWQRQTRSRYGSHLHSFMQTPSFVLEVPHRLHLNYNYYGQKQLLTIGATQILSIPFTVSIEEGNYRISYYVLGTVYQFGIWLPLLLLLNTGYVIRSRYNFWSYIACYSPMFILIAMFI